ncbi:MAG: hypothetical protein WDO68_00620 [Gammaproteobacteria bacterium]
MSAVLLAIFPDYDVASRVRVALFEDGFPTDRVELTACCEPGRAALQPADTPHRQFATYFSALLTAPDEKQFPERFACRLDDGAAAVTVHPRGPVETSRATAILTNAEPTEVVRHQITDQRFEHAAARTAKPWVSHLWVENHSNAHCIYCRLFEKDLP